MAEDLFELLRQDHERIESLMRKIEADHDAAARDRLFGELRGALETHALTEEEILYPRLDDIDETEGLAEAAEDEHAQMRDCLELLGSMSARDAQWETLFRELRNAFDHHVELEESKIFDGMREVFEGQELARLRDRFVDEKRALETPNYGIDAA